jgi:hypothetical protein
LASGYPAEQLYNYLIQQGYDKKLVRQAFTQLHNQYQTQIPQSIVHTHELSSSTITKVGVMIIVVAVLIGGFFFLLQGLGSHSKSVKLLQVELELASSKLRPGDELKFQVNSINEGDPGLVDIQFKYVITDAADRVVDDWLDSKAFQTRMQFLESYDLSDFPPGTYKLSVSAFYGSQQSSSAYRKFVVLDEDSDLSPSTGSDDYSFDDENSQDQEVSTSESDSGSDYDRGSDDQSSLVEEPEVVVPKDAPESDDDILSKASSASSPEEMAGFCSLLSDASLKGSCYSSLAERFSDSSYCSFIEDQSSREDCLINFVLMDDLTVCDDISLPENVNLCNELKQVHDIQNYLGGEGSEDDILVAAGYSLNQSIFVNESVDLNESSLSLDDFSISDFV